MGDKYYFLVFVLIIGILIALYHIFDFGVKYYFVAGGIVLFYLSMKDVISGSKWLPTPKEKNTPYVPCPEKQVACGQPFTATETIIEGYKDLIRLGMSEKYRKDFATFIETLDSYNGEEEDDTVLNNVMDYLDDGNHFYHFIMRLDWKADIGDLLWRLESSARDNFGIALNFPDPDKKYGSNTSVSSCNVFADYDDILRQTGLQMGFIDTESDEYVIIVHRINDHYDVENAVSKIGYKYFESMRFKTK